MRKAVALFWAITFLLLILVLMASILGIYTSYQKKFPPDIAQNSLLIRSVTKILDRTVKDINDSDTLQALFGTYPLGSSDGDFVATVNLKPLSNKININTYALKGINPYIDLFLTNLLRYYEIQDPQFFKDLLRDTLDKDLNEREGESEIRLYDPNFANGAIYSWRHFYKILDYYAQKRDDKTIFAVPWKELIYLGPLQEESIIDCNLLSQNIVQFLSLKHHTSIDCRNLRKFPENRAIMQALHIEPYEQGKNFWIAVDIIYHHHTQEENITLKYDLKTKKVQEIASNPLY